MKKMITKTIFVLFVLLLFNFCKTPDEPGIDNKSDSSNAISPNASNYGKEYIMPDLDIFVIRSNTGNEQFNIKTKEDPITYLKKVFAGNLSKNSVNYFLSQNKITFLNSRIRIFYIKVPHKEVNLGKLVWKSSFTLTDKTGVANKGTVINEKGPLKIFLANQPYPNSSYSGVAYLGYPGTLILSRSTYRYDRFLYIVAHELGHNFSLHHPFSKSSCSPAPKGSTNRVMDYTSRPEIFAGCEQTKAYNWAKKRGYPKKRHNLDIGPDFRIYTGNWSGQKTIGKTTRSAVVKEDWPIEVD